MENLINLFKHAFMSGGKSGFNMTKGRDFKSSDEWIEENLHKINEEIPQLVVDILNHLNENQEYISDEDALLEYVKIYINL